MSESIKYYQKILKKEIEKINIEGNPKELYEPIKYIINLKSKRFRPNLILMSHKLFKDDLSEVIKPAIAVEFFHNFTMIHDDIMDNADIRRGNQTIHKKWNKNIGILSGDLLMIFAYRMLEDISLKKFKNVLKKFNYISIKVCEGQQYDMNYENDNIIKEKEYIEMIRLKTAVLIGFSLELGGVIGDCSKKQSESLYKIGEYMGIGFQLKDDYLDVFGTKKFGKKIGGDIIHNKKTYLLIKLIEKAENKDLIQINNFLKNEVDQDKKVKYITEMMKKYKIDQITLTKINYYFDKGFELLSELSKQRLRVIELKNYLKKMMNRNV